MYRSVHKYFSLSLIVSVNCYKKYLSLIFASFWSYFLSYFFFNRRSYFFLPNAGQPGKLLTPSTRILTLEFCLYHVLLACVLLTSLSLSSLALSLNVAHPSLARSLSNIPAGPREGDPTWLHNRYELRQFGRVTRILHSSMQQDNRFWWCGCAVPSTQPLDHSSRLLHGANNIGSADELVSCDPSALHSDTDGESRANALRESSSRNRNSLTGQTCYRVESSVCQASPASCLSASAISAASLCFYTQTSQSAPSKRHLQSKKILSCKRSCGRSKISTSRLNFQWQTRSASSNFC